MGFNSGFKGLRIVPFIYTEIKNGSTIRGLGQGLPSRRRRTYIHYDTKCWRGVVGVLPVEGVLPCVISINLRVHFMTLTSYGSGPTFMVT